MRSIGGDGGIVAKASEQRGPQRLLRLKIRACEGPVGISAGRSERAEEAVALSAGLSQRSVERLLAMAYGVARLFAMAYGEPRFTEATTP